MIRRALNAPITWFVLLVIAAVAVTTLHARQEASTNYQNQIAGCERGNPLRRGVVLALSTAAEKAAQGNAQYQQAVTAILAAPHVLADGSVVCKLAVKHP
jgi:hypothetical protein